MSRKVRVLIVDDSAVIRNMLTALLSEDPGIEVVGTAIDPYAARRKLLELRPDVMTLDVEMPRMDGLTFLRKVMVHMPTPTIVFSSLTHKGSETAMRAYEVGAVAVLTKPVFSAAKDLKPFATAIALEIKMAASANLDAIKKNRTMLNAPRQAPSAMARTTHQVFAIASSTGGTEALKTLLSQFSADIPGTVIVQHMPPGFTTAFAGRLNELMPFEVREAQDGDRVIPGRVLIAPGNFHMEMARSGAFYYVKLNQNPTENSVRPAADVLMRSVAETAGRNAIGVVLTGMGKDGAQGLKAMHDTGSYTLAQDEASSVVFGMPKSAIEAGAVDRVLPLKEIAAHMMMKVKEREVA
ncbi:protein-glutamate methylesterase/protein-glutamine glutaminase [Oligoflexus tunisiensis]|uniref:protein-glutamate methylesterase/protein-glutamine glutaminase n=1 Tax=Oligoflexus tunisiensis TaxID=708132 RepID=UPI000A763476|nr:chemotaxis response regulator protein-glutamate methylesterase [Oligoflexus tunisiensis]